MKKISSNVWFALLFIVVSIAIYALQVTQFGTPGDTAFYFLQDMAFLPLQVVIVTIVLGKVLKTREKRESLKKMNMAIGAFFSEAGTVVLVELMKFNPKSRELQHNLNVTAKWTNRDFQRALIFVKSSDFSIDWQIGDLSVLKTLLAEKRGFLLSMLGNPNLLEHDLFTDMLWAVFHLADELAARDSLAELPDSDLDHMAVDIKRALNALLVQWLSHMAHLLVEYPYLFSLEARRNPFQDEVSVIIR